ncbi:pyruvate kinase alpha/beta domain-containing protein [Bacillus licheniformis]|nr:pyruvate kinase alpha/beta domain-containing protein [Bacillus licheniformis]
MAHTAINLDVNAIVTPTESGHTARMISKYRPQAPIVAVTVNDAVSRKLSLVFGFRNKRTNHSSTDEMLEKRCKITRYRHRTPRRLDRYHGRSCR